MFSESSWILRYLGSRIFIPMLSLFFEGFVFHHVHPVVFLLSHRKRTEDKDIIGGGGGETNTV